MIIENIKPEEIEKKSFEIISYELNSNNIILEPENEMIIKRAIHTTADFDYAKTMKFSKDAVLIAKELIKDGAHIVTDTNMTLSGINKKEVAKYGGAVHCFMADEDVAKEASMRGVTRATVSMERAAKLGVKTIFAVGNAPTALISLYDMIINNSYRPDFVIGVPVGFVNVVYAKELIMNTDIPYIVNEGRKGGSNVAAAICNAILYELRKEP